MKLLTITLTILIGSYYEAPAQKLTFAYDSAGNQIERLWETTIMTSQGVLKQKKVLNSKTDRISFIPKTKLSADSTHKTSISLLFVRDKNRDHKNKTMHRAEGSTP